MKFREIFRFEFQYQLRQVSVWIYFVLLLTFAFVMLRLSSSTDGSHENAPAHIAFFTVLGNVIWLLVAAAVAGDAATRDVQTRMYSLTYTIPMGKADYLGGKFLAAFALNAIILLGIPAGALLAFYAPGAEIELLGPFRPDAYTTAYGFIALPMAFVATAIQFLLAALSGRAMASYIGSVLLLLISHSGGLIARELAILLDITGIHSIIGIFKDWTPTETNTRLIAMEGELLWNRLLWLGLALGALAFTYHRFEFAHGTAGPFWRKRIFQRQKVVLSETPGMKALPLGANGSKRDSLLSVGTTFAGEIPVTVPHAHRTFGLLSHLRQTLAIAWMLFRKPSKYRVMLLLVAVMAIFLIVHDKLELHGVPLFPGTAFLIKFLTAPVGNVQSPLLIVPLLIIFYAGELVWREREVDLSDITNAAPVPEWVLFLGRFLGLGFVLIMWMALLMATGILIQLSLGYYNLELWVYLKIFFVLQLADYLLFALLALVVHVVVNQKYPGHLVALLAYGFIAFASRLGFEHHLLVYGTDPGWSYTDMQGFGPFLEPWLWFKLYWMAWALLLAVGARLLWVRGREKSFRSRLQLVRQRFTLPTALVAAVAFGLILTLGSFIFYNTNVLNEYLTASDSTELRADYERRYGQYKNISQPQLTGTILHVEIYPKQRAVDIRGTYRLVNSSTTEISSIHLATAPEAETGAVRFDRPATLILADEELFYRIYVLERPLRPGDSLQLSFEVQAEPKGFQNSGGNVSLTANGTYFQNSRYLPAIGYQPGRELSDAGDRRIHGFLPRPRLLSLYEVEARQRSNGKERISFDAVVGTGEDQLAVAPGVLRRTWTEGRRRYFHYSAEEVGTEYSFFSAKYAMLEARWKDVSIRIFHHPEHTNNQDRMLRSVEVSLDYYTEHFGPYPYRYLTLVQHPGFHGMRASAGMIAFQEGFSLFNPEDNPQGYDFPFSVVAHELAHQYWGSHLAPENVEGIYLLSESLAEYSAIQVLEKTYGREHLRRYLAQLRKEMQRQYEIPSRRADVPLLRANNDFLAYYKGPFAMYALSENIGKEQVNRALRRFYEAHRSGVRPLQTTIDLYRELQAVTPDSFQYLLHDLFEANTFWEIEIEKATARQNEAGVWKVTLEVGARKVVVDETGKETEVKMDDWIEIGIFAPAGKGGQSGKPLYLQKHRIKSGKQKITVTVTQKPAIAGIDPNHLLIDLLIGDNVEEVNTGR